MANAAIAFPNTIHKIGGEYQTNINSAREIVEVVVAEYGIGQDIFASNKRACLVFRTNINPTYAAWGELSDSIESALESLLVELGKILVHHRVGLPALGQSAGRNTRIL